MNKINDLIWWANELGNRELHELAFEIKSDLEELDKTSIHWSTLDFETKAREIEGFYSKEDIYDRNKFKEALEVMISNHDASVGINWNDVENILDTYCKK